MQQLEVELKNAPMDASQVRSSTTCLLNKEETLSASGKSLASNNLEVNYSDDAPEVLKTKVYVLSIGGDGLMPCSRAKARKLLKEGKAKIVDYRPFVIQLNFECENVVQFVTLGIDVGYGNVGASATTDKQELFRSEYKLRSDISKLLTEKSMYRKGRRNKKWYREPRFNNRRRKEGSLPPSVQHRLDSHVRIVDKICSYLPVFKVVLEVANFDIQKINNPLISGKQYQQGSLLDYENMKSYLIDREHAKCQLCGEASTKSNSFRTHHIIQETDGVHSYGKQLKVKKDGVVLNFSVNKVERHYHVNSWSVLSPT